VAPPMGHSWSGELKAAIYGASLFDEASVCIALHRVRTMLREREVCVVGPLADNVPDSCEVVISVEGVEPLYSGPFPSIIVGDGDSGGLATYSTCGFGRYCFLHFHGDNMILASELAGAARGWLVPTSQAFCVPPLLGIGGYTDGDRAVILAMVMGASYIKIIGFNFNNPVCLHKRSRLCNILYNKKTKLALAQRIIEYVSRRLGYIWEGSLLYRIEN